MRCRAPKSKEFSAINNSAQIAGLTSAGVRDLWHLLKGGFTPHGDTFVILSIFLYMTTVYLCLMCTENPWALAVQFGTRHSGKAGQHGNIP
jgi:hypothetical protein